MPGARDFLASLMSPREGPQIGSAEYQQMLADNMKRYHGDRDTAVMNTNIAGGYGNSTAQRFMHEGGGVGIDPMATGGIPLPTPRPEAPLPDPVPIAATGPGIGSGIPMPEQGIGSGIPVPQLPYQPTGSLNVGDAPALPVQGVPKPQPRPAQYTIKDKGKKKKKGLS